MLPCLIRGIEFLLGSTIEPQFNLPIANVYHACSYWDNNQLAEAVRNGALTKGRLQDMAIRY